jgi:hypothetical protein
MLRRCAAAICDGIILGTDIERPTSAPAGALDYVGIGSLLRTPRRAVNFAVARPALIETRPRRDRASFRRPMRAHTFVLDSAEPLRAAGAEHDR